MEGCLGEESSYQSTTDSVPLSHANVQIAQGNVENRSVFQM